jgi:hypothetical protein
VKKLLFIRAPIWLSMADIPPAPPLPYLSVGQISARYLGERLELQQLDGATLGVNKGWFLD